jgi:putative DNA primase/helicase
VVSCLLSLPWCVSVLGIAATTARSESSSTKMHLIDTYFKERGITGPIPPTIRFHPNLKHTSGVSLPTMVALVTRGMDEKPVGILRTFLAPNGKGKAKCVPNKMMLGPCSGGAVQLGEAGNSVMVGEGIVPRRRFRTW